MSEMEGDSTGPKKALQEMSQDELIKKCKGLLLIAQKAKSAKDGKATM